MIPMIPRAVKNSLFIAVAANFIVLIDVRNFYWDTRPGAPDKTDICSANDAHSIGIVVSLAFIAAFFFGFPMAIWGVFKGLRQRARHSVWVAVIAVILNLIPYKLEDALNAYVVHVHASQISRITCIDD